MIDSNNSIHCYWFANKTIARVILLRIFESLPCFFLSFLVPPVFLPCFLRPILEKSQGQFKLRFCCTDVFIFVIILIRSRQVVVSRCPKKTKRQTRTNLFSPRLVRKRRQSTVANFDLAHVSLSEAKTSRFQKNKNFKAGDRHAVMMMGTERI